MALVLPNIEDALLFDFFAVRDSADFAAIAQDASGTGVVSGCGVTQHTGSDMLCTIAAGTFYIGGVKNVLAGSAQATVTTAGATDRRDSVVAGLNGTLNATHTNGAGAITSIAVLAIPVAIPSGSTLVFLNGDQAITSAPATLGATTISINSYTPTTTITTGTQFTPLWVIAGTVCGTAGWTVASSGNPPVKTLNGAGTVMLGEVGVPNSLTVVVNADIVDKTANAQVGGQLAGTLDGNGQMIANLASLLVGESTSSSTAGIEIATTATYATGPTYYGIHLADTITFTTTNPSITSGMLRIDSAWDLQKYNTFGSVAALTFTPTITTHTGQTPAFVLGANVSPILAGVNLSSGTFYGLTVLPVFNGTGTQASSIAIAVGNRGGVPSGTYGTFTGVDIGVDTALPTASTIWGIRVTSGINNQFMGLTAFGGNATPLYAVHLKGGNAAGTSYFGANTSTTGPTVPASPLLSGGDVAFGFYRGTGGVNTYLLYAFDDAGTTRYKYLQLNSTGVTWVTGTTLPT